MNNELFVMHLLTNYLRLYIHLKQQNLFCIVHTNVNK